MIWIHLRIFVPSVYAEASMQGYLFELDGYRLAPIQMYTLTILFPRASVGITNMI